MGSPLSKFISERTPKFNKYMVEGLCYHRLKHAIDYIDRFIRYSVESKTNTHLRYLGYREVPYKEELKFLLGKNNKQPFDIAQNDLYLVEFIFHYGEEEEDRKYYFYIPYINKGNTLKISDKEFLVMPILADKVISIGDKIIFINILTAKYSFSRDYYSIVVNKRLCNIALIKTELYKNQSTKLEATTKAKITVMHYLLANYGFKWVCQTLLGFIPEVSYDYDGSDKIVIESTGIIPRGYVKPKELYQKSRIKFLINKEQYNEVVHYVLGNIIYIIDNFPDVIQIDNLDNTLIWKKLLAEIIHSGNYTLDYLMEKITAHFEDLNSNFDTVVVDKLKDVGVSANNLMELMVIIFKNFNNWIMTEDTRSLYYNKTFEVESYVLSEITSRITKTVLDINKEELRIGDRPLDKMEVDKIFKTHFRPKSIFRMKQNKQYKQFVTSIEYSGDHLYPKNTAMIVEQESDFINTENKNANRAEKKKIIASMATIGSILALSKKNPTPLIRLNPFVNMDYKTGTVLPPEDDELVKIIEETDRLLTMMNPELEVNEELDSVNLEDDSIEEDNYEEMEDEVVDSSDD